MPAEDTYISKSIDLGISISTARATFFDENVEKRPKSKWQLMRMYVCMFGNLSSPCMAKTAHTYIHTHTRGYLQLVDYCVVPCMFEVCVKFRGKKRENPKKIKTTYRKSFKTHTFCKT